MRAAKSRRQPTEGQHERPGRPLEVLGGYVRFYPDEALDRSGGQVLVRAVNWRANVVRDRELITGQNPASDGELAHAFLAALKSQPR